MARKPAEARRGDVVEIRWVDIIEDPVGDPSAARLARRTSYGVFWERRRDGDVDAVVTTTTIDHDDGQQSGYCIYPEACIRSLSIVRRARTGVIRG